MLDFILVKVKVGKLPFTLASSAFLAELWITDELKPQIPGPTSTFSPLLGILNGSRGFAAAR